MHTSRSGLALIATVCALLAVPAAAPAQQDLRAPDTRDAARFVGGGQDLRSPDARDAAEGRTIGSTIVEEVRVPVPVASGFDWMDAVVGFVAAVGLAMLLTAGALLVRRRKPIAA